MSVNRAMVISTLLAGSCFPGHTAVALADAFAVSRLSDYRVHFGDSSSFTDASFAGRVVSGFSGEAGDVFSTSFNFGTNWANRQIVSTDPGIASLIVEESPGDPNILNYDITWSQSGLVSAEITWTSLPVTSTLNVLELNGQWVLESGSGGFDIPGISYEYRFTAPGDWSAIGTAPGQAELIALNPSWTIVDFFVFDGTHTTFRAVIDEYTGSFDDPNVLIRLHGAVIPGPGALSALGLACIGMMRRRRG